MSSATALVAAMSLTPAAKLFPATATAMSSGAGRGAGGGCSGTLKRGGRYSILTTQQHGRWRRRDLRSPQAHGDMWRICNGYRRLHRLTVAGVSRLPLVAPHCKQQCDKHDKALQLRATDAGSTTCSCLSVSTVIVSLPGTTMLPRSS